MPHLTQHRLRALMLNLNGYTTTRIFSAILAEIADALIQWDATAATLKALGCSSIERVLRVILPAGRNARQVMKNPSVDSLFLALTMRVNGLS